MLRGRAMQDVSRGRTQFPRLQFRDEQLRELTVGMLKVNRTEMLVLELVAVGRSISECLEQSRQQRDAGERVLASDRSEGNVVVDEGRSGRKPVVPEIQTPSTKPSLSLSQGALPEAIGVGE